MLELTPVQTAALERLVAHGYTPVTFPLYSSAIGVRRDSFAALLTPFAGGGLRVLGDPCVLIDGNLSVRVHRNAREWFVCKSKSAEATPDLLAQLSRFSKELSDLLSAS